MTTDKLPDIHASINGDKPFASTGSAKIDLLTASLFNSENLENFWSSIIIALKKKRNEIHKKNLVYLEKKNKTIGQTKQNKTKRFQKDLKKKEKVKK